MVLPKNCGRFTRASAMLYRTRTVTRAGSCPYRRPTSSTRMAPSRWPTSTWTTAIAWSLLRSLSRSSRCRKNTEENIMQTLPDNYFNAYRSLKLTRDAEGVLVAQFHTDGGPFTFTAKDHTEFRSEERRVGKECRDQGSREHNKKK